MHGVCVYRRCFGVLVKNGDATIGVDRIVCHFVRGEGLSSPYPGAEKVSWQAILP